jgi:hypothetical protein
LRTIVDAGVLLFLELYLPVLEIALGARDTSLLREIHDRFVDAIEYSLAVWVRFAWDLRGKVRLSELDRFDLRYTIQYNR